MNFEIDIPSKIQQISDSTAEISKRHATLEAIVATIAAGSDNDGTSIVRQIRMGLTSENIAASAKSRHELLSSPKKGEQIARFSAPGKWPLTTFVESVVQPTASSKDSIIHSTLVTKGEQGKSEKRKYGSHDGKNSTKRKGRPRLDIGDSIRAEKRRTQIKLAQRTYRLRQVNTIKSLQNKASNLENVISQTITAFLDIQEKVLASGILNQAPELSRSFRSTIETLSLAKAIAADQSSNGDNAEDEGEQERTSARVLSPIDRGSKRAAADKAAQDSVGERMQHVFQNQQLSENALHSDVLQVTHQIISDDNFKYTAAPGVVLAPSPRIEDNETDQGYIDSLGTEEPYLDIIGTDQVTSVPRRLLVKRMSEINTRTTNARRKNKAIAQNASGLRMRDREVLRSPQEVRYSLAPSTIQPMPGTPMYEVFLESFLDAFAAVAPGHRSRDWFRAAAEVRLSSPMLYNAFLSVSASYFGSSVGDSRIVFAAHKVYINVLKELQKALLSSSRSRSQWTLFTVVVAVHYEMLQNTSEKGMIKHMIGALKIIEFRGSQCHIHGLEHLFFVTYRNYLITTAIACRSPTFLAKEEWKTVPWSINPTSKDLVQHLLDHLADIPTLLAHYDSLEEATAANSLPLSEILDRRTIFQISLVDIERRLHQWKNDYADPVGQPFEVSSQVGALGRPQDPQFPIFRCQDSSSGAFISPLAIAYPEPELARALCLYYAALLTISFVDIRTEGGLLPHERYNLACLICRSTEYFLQVAPNHSIRVLGSLRVAYDTFPRGGTERQWVKNMFQVIGKAEHMKATTSLARDFSVQANASQ